MNAKEYVRKYFIMGSQNCSRNPIHILHEALEAGITAFQYREKGAGALTGREKVELGKSLRQLCARYDIPFFMNDDVELAIKLEADGIHVGQQDTPVADIRANYPHLQIGLSISNVKELQQSPLELVDYIGVGPIFPTTTKEDAKEAVTTKWVTYVRHKHPNMVIVGIGGITTENATEVIRAGADGVAVISTITNAKDIAQTVKKL